MPAFNEQLRIVAGLRTKCRECDESLYRARLRLQRSDQRLKRAAQQPTIVNSERDRETGTRRAEIARLDARLATLREELRQLDRWFAQLTEYQRLIHHQQQLLTAAEERIASLRRELAELEQQDPPEPNRIENVKGEIARLEHAQADLNNSLLEASESLRRLAEEEDEQRRRREQLHAEIERLRGQLRSSQAQLVRLLQPVFPNRDELQAEHADAETAHQRLQDNCGDCEGKLHDAIVGLYSDAHPRGGLRSLDDATPFLLFPVRLETIFVPLGGGGDVPARTELWVRIYPDDVVVHTHEKVLTDTEVVAGELYWTELLSAEHLTEEKDNRRRAAWRHIVELFGGQRASWIARQTKPADWDSLSTAAANQTLIDLLRTTDPGFFNGLRALKLPAITRAELERSVNEDDSDAFSRLAEEHKWFDRIDSTVRTTITGFPAHDLTKIDAWSRAPRTEVLPDRFVLLLFNSETGTPREIVGNVIPDTLTLGPDPLDSKKAFTNRPSDNALVYGGAFDWMSNFDKAVEQGMGFRVPLTDAEARNGFAKVFVLGVFLSANANDSAAMLEELIDNHQYSPKGFTIVSQGTPTNNTERNGTGFSDNDPFNDLAFFTATDPPAFDPFDPDPKNSQTDGRFLADALGIGYEHLQTLPSAKQTDLLEARSVNTALFPGTWGYWLKQWMSPVVTESAARETRKFFNQFVTGRGPLPAIRIGNQPYGMLLTSDFSRWRYSDRSGPILFLPVFQEEVSYLRSLHRLLLELQQIWDSRVAELPFVGKPNTDSADVLMKILGLHPTSVEFYQRIGYSHEYLRNLFSFKDRGRFAGELNTHMLGLPAIARSYLQEQGITRDDETVRKMLSLHVLWQHYVTPLNVPNLVENKPPSETSTLTVNYINFLATAETTQKIINQEFPTAPPSALLYLMLRNALLLQMHNGSFEWLKERTIFEPALVQATQATTLAGMRATVPTISKFEIMGTKVEVAEPTNPVPSMTIADWIWSGPTPAEVEAAYLQEQKAALLNLVNTPTARLERCLVEHIDCCNYRLDAWQTGLFAQRLQSLRGSGDTRTRGIYLGAFGWVENLVPKAKTFLNADSLPPSLRPADAQPILEEDEVLTSPPGAVGAKQGGFVHAPSLNHASAAALLRNAYLSHATPAQADMFAVNLSSERVRRGQFILEGMRNGQPIEALLGYQFERGLHDRTSRSEASGEVPVLELNQFILPFRQAFPFESIEVVQTGTGAPSETVPPYSVVNGLKLSQAALSAANGFGLDQVLPAADRPKANQGAAIVAEQNALSDTLDAVKDLLMAENAYQLARGNFDRVAAISLAQKEAHIPPELEVVNTPRGTEFTFTNRVTLHFDDLDPLLPENNPWPVSSMSPRANAEPGMNQWLGRLFGPPEQIVCRVFWVEDEDDSTRRDEATISLVDLGVQPVDFVWLVNVSLEQTQGATELETRIAFEYRRTSNIGDQKVVRIEFDGGAMGAQKTFAQLFPLARQLRALLSESRALHAQDFLPEAGGKESAIPFDKNNPRGYDVAELRTRVQTTLNELSTLADFVDGSTAPTVELVFLNDPTAPPFVGQLGAAYTKLEDAKLLFTDSTQLTVTFSHSKAETLHRNLRLIAGFGVADAFPPESDLTIESTKTLVLARAHRIARRLRSADRKDGVLDRATALISSATTDKTIDEQVALLLQAGRILFGETFNWLPKFTCHNEIDLATADGDRNQLLKFAVDATPGITGTEVVEEWLQGLGRVRPQLHRWEIVRTLADALNDVSLDLRPAQVPFRVNDSWLAVEFPKNDPNNTDPEEPEKPFGISRDTLSIVAQGDSAFQTGRRQSGVLLDDWTEEIPTAEETTGISFRFNQPNASPPQTLLLVVTPEQTGSWDWDDLVGTLSDTLRRAKRRAVEPAQLEQQGMAWNAFAPALVSEFSTLFQNDISLDLMGMLDFKPLDDFYRTRG